MRKNHRFLRVDTACKIIDNHVIHIILNVFGGVSIGNYLIIGNDNVGWHAEILQANTLF